MFKQVINKNYSVCKGETMSEQHEFEVNPGVDPTTFLPEHEKVSKENATSDLAQYESSVDGKTYLTGEVPQNYMFDPNLVLPLNSDRLIGSVNVVDKLLFEIGILIEEDVAMIQKHQKKITFWEDRIEKNRTFIKRNEFLIKKNAAHAVYDKKNRDYWTNRAEEVETDYSHAEIAQRPTDWAWLIRKYGLKNANGQSIESESPYVEELCNGEIRNLAGEYRNTANKYEIARREKENENGRLVQENAKFQQSIEILQKYIAAAYSQQIEPIQDGILLMKELGLKVRTIGENNSATYGELRSWAEPFLDDFIRANPKVPQEAVTHFRRLTSIPLPPEYS
jgi:hypothetical protein